MKVGDYIRTKEGIIDKVIIEYNEKSESVCPICNCKHVSCEHNYYDEDTINKSSPNIIDLIEVGDYVNGEKVIALEKDIDKRNIYPSNKGAKIFTDYELQGNWYFGMQDEDIKTIVTKEQFEQMEYKIN